MNSLERVIGQLEAHHQDVKRRLVIIEIKIDSLQKQQWKRLGSSAVISFIVTTIVTAAIESLHFWK